MDKKIEEIKKTVKEHIPSQEKMNGVGKTAMSHLQTIAKTTLFVFAAYYLTSTTYNSLSYKWRVYQTKQEQKQEDRKTIEEIKKQLRYERAHPKIEKIYKRNPKFHKWDLIDDEKKARNAKAFRSNPFRYINGAPIISEEDRARELKVINRKAAKLRAIAVKEIMEEDRKKNKN